MVFHGLSNHGIKSTCKLEQNKKIKVLRIINRFNIGGPTYNAAYLTKYLDDRFETMLVGGAKDESEASSEFILDSLDLKPTLIQNMRRSIGLSDISAYRQISQIIKEFKPDIVHTHASKSGFLGRLAAYRKQCTCNSPHFSWACVSLLFRRLQDEFLQIVRKVVGQKIDTNHCY